MAKMRVADVWAYVRALKGPFGRKEVAEYFGVSEESAKKHLVTIRTGGGIKVYRVIKGVSTTYVVANRSANFDPKPRPLVGREEKKRGYIGTTADGRTDWPAVTELEKCWGVGRIRVDARRDMGFNSPREDAPAENASKPA